MIDNVVDYDEMDSFLAWKMKGNLLDHTFPVGSKYGRWNTIARVMFNEHVGRAVAGMSMLIGVFANVGKLVLLQTTI